MLETEKFSVSKIVINTSGLCFNSWKSQNSDSFIRAGDSMALSTQDREMFSILDDLNNVSIMESNNGIVTSWIRVVYINGKTRSKTSK